MLSQIGLRNELYWRSLWQSFYYLGFGFLIALNVLLLSYLSHQFLLPTIIISLTLFITFSLPSLRVGAFFFPILLLNFLGIIAALSPVNGEMAFQRFCYMGLSALLVFIVRFLFFSYEHYHRVEYTEILFWQKMKQLYQIIFSHQGNKADREKFESRFQAAWSDCLAIRQWFHFNASKNEVQQQLDNIWDITLSLGSLRYRITEEAFYSLSQKELQLLSQAITSIVDQYIKSIRKPSSAVDFQPLEKAIQQFENLYQTTLQTVIHEPLVVLLFIQDGYALKDALTLLFTVKSSITQDFLSNKKVLSPLAGIKALWERRTKNPLSHSAFLWELLWVRVSKPSRISAAVFLALLITHYFSNPPHFWIPIITLLLTQTEVALPLHQTLQRFLWIVVILYALYHTSLPYMPIIIAALSTFAAYWYAYTSRRYLSLHFPLLLMMVMLTALLMPSSDYLYEVLIGAIIAVLANLFIFPDKPDIEFAQRVIPLLQYLSNYLSYLTHLLLQTSTDLANSRVAIENIWVNRDVYFPVWVFEPGFNPVLKPGHSHFAIHLGQISEILFAMHHFARHDFDQEFLNKLSGTISECVDRTNELFVNVIAMLNEKKPSLSQANFIDDMTALEENFRSTVNVSIELLDISGDYIYLAAFIRYLKDLRLHLLRLIESLHSAPLLYSHQL